MMRQKFLIRAVTALITTSSPVNVTVTNDEAPTVLDATVNAGTKIVTLTVSEALTITNAAVANDFSVLVDSVSNSVTAAELSNDDTVLTLTLTDYVLNGQSVSVGYTSSGYLQDSFSQELQSFSKASTVVNDDVPPSIVGVSSTTDAGSYKVGEQIDIAVKFSETVLVTGSPRLTLETGLIDTKATYASGSGSDTLIFSYTVVSGDTSDDLDYASTAAITLSGGTIKDIAGNAATTTLSAPGTSGSLGASEALVIDTTPPSVSVSDISYNSSLKTITITGTGFSDINSVDWTKFKLDINNDGSTTADHTFSDDDISSTTISDTEIKAVLVDGTGTAYGHDEITNLAGFGATDGASSPSMVKDNFEIATGFFIDAAGNAGTDTADIQWKIPTLSSANYLESTRTLTLKGQDLDLLSTDAVEASNLNWSNFSWLIDGTSGQSLESSDITAVARSSSLALDITLSSTANLITTTGFLGSTADKFTVTDGFITGLDSSILPTAVDIITDELGPTITNVTLQGLVDGDFISPSKPATILINLNEEVVSGTAITGQINVTTASVSTAPYPIIFEALADGTVLTGVFTPASNDNQVNAIDIQDLSLSLPDGSSQTKLKDVFGNETTSIQLTIPSGKNISGNVGDILVDAVAPVAQPTGVAYDVAANTITITAATTDLGFTGITSDTTQDIQSYLDWTKFKWILNEQDAGGTTVNFNGDGATTAATNYVTSAKITSDTTMVVTLGSAGVTALEGNAGFGNLGGPAFGEGTDAVKIFEGFVKDAAGNSADLDGSGDIDATNDYVLFSDVNAKVSGGSGNTAVTYTNAGNAPTITSFALTNNGGADKSTYIAGDTVLITATADMTVTKGSTFTAVLDVTGTGSVGVTDPTLTFTAAADGTTLTATHTIASGENIAAAIITSANYGLGATTLDSQYTGGGLTSTFPTNSNISGVGIDAVAPVAQPTGVAYDVAANTITITAATTDLGFTGITSDTTQDIQSYLDWTKFKWILNEQEDDAATVNFNGDSVTTAATNYVTSAKITSDTTMVITLGSAGVTALEGNAGFGNLGGTAFGEGTDAVQIFEGFVKDAAGNSADLDGSGDIDATNDYVLFSDVNAKVSGGSGNTAVTYTNAGNAPTITSFALTNNGGADKSTYIAGDTVLITATADMNCNEGVDVYSGS